jgi:hypothetical protein
MFIANVRSQFSARAAEIGLSPETVDGRRKNCFLSKKKTKSFG